MYEREKVRKQRNSDQQMKKGINSNKYNEKLRENGRRWEVEHWWPVRSATSPCQAPAIFTTDTPEVKNSSTLFLF